MRAGTVGAVAVERRADAETRKEMAPERSRRPVEVLGRMLGRRSR